MKAKTIIAILLLPAALWCCQKEKDSAASATVRVGALFPLSGDLQDKGRDSLNGVKMAVDEINASGGISALGGTNLEVIVADTQGKPEIGIKETNRLIQEESVAAIIGTYQSSVTKAATQAAERLETPFIVSISIADIITERGFAYTFRIQPKAGFYARDQVQFLVDLKALAGYTVNRVALLYENTDFGTSAALAQKRALRERDLQVVADISYKAEGVTDLDKEVSRALAAEPDAILTVTYLMDSILIRRALASSGKSIPMVDTAGGTVSPEYIQQLGAMAEGTFSTAEFSKFAAGGRELNQRFQDRYHADITGDSTYAYQAVLVLKDALERSGSADRKKLRKALSGTDIKQGSNLVLPAPELRFDSSGQNEFAHLYVVQIQNGELVPVWPLQYATAAINLNE
jgi:branched-chain amino acid transport system substrate-binding protein